MATTKQKSLVREIMDVLKEQRSLFALMLAYAGAIVAALFNWHTITQKWTDLSQGTSVWILYAFAFLPVLVPAAVVIVRRWRRASLERRLVDVGKERLSFRHGHFRTAPYSGGEEDRGAYQRTDHAHEEALDRIRMAAGKGEPFFFLHSPSGCGKTSLLQASVMPALEEQGWRVISLRGFTGILPELAEALGLAETATVGEIRTALTAKATTRREAGGTLLVAVDQFEEFLILHPSDTVPWQAVREWFTALRGAPVPGLLVLLSLRSEYQTPALKLGLPDFDTARSFVVPLFTAEDAREFLRRGLEAARKKTGELPLDQFIRQMEDRDDTRGMVRPIQANLVGHAYRTYAAEFHARLLAGKRVDFLADWLHRLLERRELRLHARPVFEGLLQKDGSRCPARVAQIAAETGLDADVVRHCLSAFESEGLVRCLTPDLVDDHQKLWEISHDFLAVQIKRLLSFWRRLWHESLARAVAPAALGLWLIAAAGFLLQDTERIQISQLADLGFHWDRRTRRATVEPHSIERIDAAIVADAAPSLRALRCKELDLSTCKNLQNVDGLEGLNTLNRFNLSKCENLRNIDGLRGLKALTHLDLSFSDNLLNVDGLMGLTALTFLSLSNCNTLQNVNGLKDSTALTRLFLSECWKLQNVDGLKGMNTLTRLNLSGNNLKNVDSLKGLTALADLDLSSSNSLQNVDGLKGLTALSTLSLSSCKSLQNVDGLKGLTALATLDLSNCDSLQSLDVLKGRTTLTHLILSNRANLQNADALKGLALLTFLDLSECEDLQDIDALKDLTALSYLSLSDCANLQNVEGVKGLKALDFLVVSGCRKISEAAVRELKATLPKTMIEWSAKR